MDPQGDVFDDQAFPEFASGFVADEVTGYVSELPGSPELVPVVALLAPLEVH